MNIIQNETKNFKISNSLKALAGMVAFGIAMVLMGAQNGVVIWFVSTVVICGLAKAFDKFSTKQEAAAQEANIVSLADYRNSKAEAEVAA